MDSGNIDTFTRKMVLAKVFNCKICDKLLTPLVTLVENVGNVCENCFNCAYKDSLCRSLLNDGFSKIMQELKFPCKFESKGCGTELPYDQLQNHYENCIFRTVPCLATDVCDWMSKLTDLPKHVAEEHPKLLITEVHGSFSFAVNLVGFSKLCKMLKNKSSTYILQMSKCGENISHLINVIRCDGKHEQMTIKYAGKSIEYTVKAMCYPLTNCYKEEDNTTKVPYTVLEQMARLDEDFKIVIRPDSAESEELSEPLLTILECPVCKELMRSPIYQCSVGHSLCNTCRSKMSNCPTCRENWATPPNIRNFSLEALTATFQHPCMYGHFGCKETFPGNLIEEHEGVCKFKVYNCPIYNCGFTGNYLPFKNHFQLNHQEIFIEGTKYEGTISLRGDIFNSLNEERYFIEFGNIYKLSLRFGNKDAVWLIQIINNFDRNTKSLYSATVSHFPCKDTRVAKIQICSSSNSFPIKFTVDELRQCKNPSTNNVEYCCEIFMKN